MGGQVHAAGLLFLPRYLHDVPMFVEVGFQTQTAVSLTEEAERVVAEHRE